MRQTGFAALTLALVLSGCGDQGGPTGAHLEPLAVATTNYPLQYFAQRIGAELVDVVDPAPPATDPARWRPDAEAISRLRSVDLIVINGAGIESWLDDASLPEATIVDSSAAFTYRLIATGGEPAAGGPDRASADTNGGPATTVWLDPILAIRQGHAIAGALMSQRPDHRAEIHHRMEGMKSEFLNLDDRFGVAATAISDEPLLFSRPVYHYLVPRYRLNALMLDLDPGRPFDALDRDMLEGVLGTHPARWILWDEEPIPEVVATLQQLGVESRVFDPCRTEPASGDFMTVMSANAGSLETIAESVRSR